MTYEVTDELVERLKKDEGYRKHPYYDAKGILTIGYGTNLDARGLTRLESEYLLRTECESALEMVKEAKWFQVLNDARKEVILNMIYNMGFTRFLGFKKTIQFLRDKDYLSASKEMLDSKWYRVDVGHRAIVLSKQMRSGVRQ